MCLVGVGGVGVAAVVDDVGCVSCGVGVVVIFGATVVIVVFLLLCWVCWLGRVRWVGLGWLCEFGWLGVFCECCSHCLVVLDGEHIV